MMPFQYLSGFQTTFLLAELVGTPGYLAPELLKTNMFEGSEGYGKEVDMYG